MNTMNFADCRLEFTKCRKMDINCYLFMDLKAGSKKMTISSA